MRHCQLPTATICKYSFAPFIVQPYVIKYSAVKANGHSPQTPYANKYMTAAETTQIDSPKSKTLSNSLNKMPECI